MRQFVIFGAGKRGKELFELLGSSKVFCFCDNHLCGANIEDKAVVAFSELSSLSGSYTIILSTNNGDMREQLGDGGIEYCDCSISYDALRDLLKEEYEYCTDSEVEFYLVDSFELTHYVSIYNALRDAGIRAVMVAEPCLYNTAGTWFDEEKTWELLDAHGCEWYKRSNSDAPVAITTEFGHNLIHYKGRKIQLCYGVSFLRKKAFELEADVTKPFDHVLVNGQFYKKMITNNRPADTVTDIAYPRYREYFLYPGNREDIRRSLGIQSTKPILVYYPTWDDHSSISEYAEEIGKLKDTYFVISKPHHCTLRLPEKEGDRTLLKRNSDLVVDTAGSLSELAFITDLAICDAMSGALCEVAYLNRDAHMVAIMEPGTKEEFYFDPWKLSVTVETPELLGQTVRKIGDEDPCLVSRQKLIRELISDDFDDGMERCVNAIRRRIQC